MTTFDNTNDITIISSDKHRGDRSAFEQSGLERDLREAEKRGISLAEYREGKMEGYYW